jgi:hypothetical protein
MIRIFIENQELDVNQSFTNQITYAVDDIKNIDSKSTAFSKTIVLPGTTKNNKLFGNIFDFANSNFTEDSLPNIAYNFNASKSAPARIDQDGLTIIKGVLRLLEIIVDGEHIEYEVAIFGEFGGFANEIANKKLTDLDFSQYDHVYNITNIANTWTAANTILVTSVQYATSFGVNCLYIDLTNNPSASQILAGDSITTSGGAYNNGTYTVTSINNYTSGGHQMAKINLLQAISTNITLANITIQIPRSVAKGYCYPLIDYGNVSYNLPSSINTSISQAKKDFQYKAFRPAFYVREIINKIIYNAGYTWESNFFNSNFFNRLIIPNNEKGILKTGVYNYIAATKLISSSTYTYSGTSTQVNSIVWTSTPILNGFTLNGASNTFTYNGLETIEVKASVRVTGTYKTKNANGVSRIRLVAGGVELGKIEFPASGTNTINFDQTFSATKSLLTNNTIYLEVYQKGYSTTNTYTSTIVVNTAYLNVDSDPPTSIEYSYGDTIQLNNILPKNVFQKDFFTSIMKMFNLMVTEDKFVSKKLIIEPWVDFYDLDSSTYLNWSDKIDRSQPIKIKPMSETNARIYNFKYKKDSDYYNDLYAKRYNETYGDRVYDNNLEFSKDTSNTEVIFASTPLVGYAGRDKVFSTILKMNNNVEEKTESIIRILQYKIIEGVTSWKVLNQSTVLGTYTKYPYAGHFDNPDIPAADLNFGATKELFFTLVSGALSNNMFNAYYSSYMAEITDKDSRLITAKIKLNGTDIFNLDFGKFIYIDGVLYRLIKIVDYSAGDICEVQLLRVIYTTY